MRNEWANSFSLFAHSLLAPKVSEQKVIRAKSENEVSEQKSEWAKSDFDLLEQKVILIRAKSDFDLLEQKVILIRAKSDYDLLEQKWFWLEQKVKVSKQIVKVIRAKSESD